MIAKKFLPAALALLLAAAGHHASAATTTIPGILPTDASVFQYNFNAPSAQTFTFSTTSYGGGANLDGSTTSAGGFVPTLTLFNGNGSVIGPSITGGAVDPSTRLSNDALLTAALSSGTYILTLTEFPNVAIGNFADGFLFAGQGNFTPSLCGASSGSFLETDTVPCTQRTSNFTLNVASTATTSVTPEPATWMLVLPAAGFLVAFGKRSIA